MEKFESPTLELELEGGKRVKVQVTSYKLKFSDKLHVGEGGAFFKLGTFKINSGQYQDWKDIEKIKYLIGECTVLKGQPPKETPRTITFNVRQDFN
ncbi:hypothetical protein D3C77_607430 [compost metagenome]